MSQYISPRVIEGANIRGMADAPAEVLPGRPYPLGANYNGTGTNFSLFAEQAEAVELCLFDEDGNERRIPVKEMSAYCWHCYVPGVRPGQRYGYRVHGPWDPRAGMRFNGNKLLLDPYAKAITGNVQWNEACYSYRFGDELTRSDTDSGPYMPKCLVHDSVFDWEGDTLPRTPLDQTVIYEAHVKGLTMQHPSIPKDLRGTYAGLAEQVVIDHLQHLGVTAIELQPIHQFVHDQHLVDRGRRNYWGYNTIGYFAPHDEYCASKRAGDQVAEFKHMVKRLHEAGIEVILDVVYNHTAEGNHLGPTLSFRGIDNCAYYRLVQEDPRYYFDTTGTGNSLNMRHPHVLQLIMDSLRYWVEEMHVDGFRFDLAATLARELHEADRLSTFFDLIQQDPLISQVKLIAEPWDLGPGGYLVGRFPSLWSEWNGRYRDEMRDFWRGQGQLSEFAWRFLGSSDLYQNDLRRPLASINFITAHDGFTLRDLVSYNDKHNEANGENGQDGESHNRSWNCGAEGEVDDPEVVALRAKQRRNLMATLMLSQGVPMLLSGDEIGRTQRGNNNAYCQDNELSWCDWENADDDFVEFVRAVVSVRKRHPIFRRRRWFHGLEVRGTPDIAWIKPDGNRMEDADWASAVTLGIGVYLNGSMIPSLDDRGRAIRDEDFLLLFNAHHEPINWKCPEELGNEWELVLDTDQPVDPQSPFTCKAGDEVVVASRSLQVFVGNEASAGKA